MDLELFILCAESASNEQVINDGTFKQIYSNRQANQQRQAELFMQIS